MSCFVPTQDSSFVHNNKREQRSVSNWNWFQLSTEESSIALPLDGWGGKCARMCQKMCNLEKFRLVFVCCEFWLLVVVAKQSYLYYTDIGRQTYTLLYFYYMNATTSKFKFLISQPKNEFQNSFVCMYIVHVGITKKFHCIVILGIKFSKKFMKVLSIWMQIDASIFLEKLL